MNFRATLPHRLPFFYGWVIVGCAMLACYARQGAAVATLSIFVTPMSDEFGWSRTAMSGAVSLGGLIGGLMSPAIGQVVDRHGARAVLTVASLIIAATCVALAGTQSLLWFYIAFGMARLTFSAPFDVGLSAPVANWFVRRRARAMAMVSLSIGGGLAIMPLTTQLVMDEHGWRVGWIAVGVSVLLAGALPSALFMIRRPEDVGLRPDGDPARENVAAGTKGAAARDRSAKRAGPVEDEVSFTLHEAVRTRAFWLLIAFTGCIFTVQAGISLHQAPHFVHRGLDATVAASVVSVFSLSSALSSLLFGYLGGRWPLHYALALTGAATAVGAGLTAQASTALAAYVSATAFGCGMGGLMTLSALAFADYFGRASFGAIRGAAVPAQAIGQAAGPLFSGLMFDLNGDYGSAFMTYSVMAGVAAVCGYLARRPAPPHRQPAGDDV